MRRRFAVFIGLVQAVLLLAHLFLYETWRFSPSVPADPPELAPKLFFGFLSVSFVAASLLAYRFSNVAVRALYKLSAVWLGMLAFLVPGGIAAWLVFAVGRVAGQRVDFHLVVQVIFGLAAALGIFAVLNASWTRTTRKTVQLTNLPSAWRGRKAALVSDLHLGHVRNRRFLRRILRKITKESPDVVFIAGDLFDGTAIHAERAAEPLKDLAAPLGAYFVAGNHELFRNHDGYVNAVAAAGVRVLNCDLVEVDGLQLLGVSYANASNPERFASLLHGIGLDRDRASILLTHAPDHPHIAEAVGVSLQLSGHTHHGQIVPWTWLARRIYRQFVYGLSRLGNLQVLTSSGAGTWGPPLRLGTRSEIVVLEFQ